MLLVLKMRALVRPGLTPEMLERMILAMAKKADAYGNLQRGPKTWKAIQVLVSKEHRLK